ncbi:thioredoxin [Acetivibrio sp. MSJd-27]|uniref:thioredoxin n=1 Tax=Acetivibrio sp. MSJd-27 TaxID=2841523 RepID=UPI001C0FB715|nr:thioredoxin [Acetivibrio sp. MSJd-27]MBU5449947.1 thioredoxin [Acetivibrio sp. MSJd-27]
MASEKATILTNETFDEVIGNSDIPCLVDFWAEWCGPCRMLGPVIDELAEDYDGEVKVCKVNIDEQSELAMRFKVMTIPTVLLFKNGEVVDKSVGAVPKSNFVTMIGKYL